MSAKKTATKTAKKAAKPAPELTDAQLAARVKQLPQMKDNLEIHRQTLALQTEVFAMKEKEIWQLTMIGGLLALKASSASR